MRVLIKPNASSQASHSCNKCKKSLVSGSGCQASFHPLIESIHPSPLLLCKWRMTALYFHHSTLLEGLAHRICRLLWGLNTCSDPELKYLYSERENPRALSTPTSWKILSIGHDVSQPAVGKKKQPEICGFCKGLDVMGKSTRYQGKNNFTASLNTDW